MQALRRLSLRTQLLLVVAVALLPVVVLAISGVVALGRQQHAQALQALVERARAIASAVDLELFNSIEALKILALSERLTGSDLRRFHAAALAAVGARGDWVGIILIDRSGNRLLDTRVAYGAPLPGGASVVERESFDAVLAGRAPGIGRIARGPGGQARFAVRVPVLRGGEPRYVLTAVVQPDLLVEILTRQKVPAQSVSTIFDSHLTIVARSRNHEQYVGTQVSDSLGRLMGTSAEGWGTTRTLDGQNVYAAFSRSARSAWGVAIGVPKEALDAPVWRSYALSAAGVLLSIVLGVLAAAWLARRIALRLERSSAALEASNKELEAFSYSVSHDLRAPVRAIDGFSSLLQEEAGSLSDEGRRYLQMVRASAKQMGKLIDDLLRFARLSREGLARRRFEMQPLVEECIAKLRADLGGRSIECTVGKLPACEGDPALLRQVLLNLIGNAFKYTSRTASARVEIGCLSQGAQQVFYVRDNGVGFDMKYAGKLFGVFQRLHRSTEFEGTGVGLAIVQRIVQRHGGRIWAQAEPGKGATFYFTLAAP